MDEADRLERGRESFRRHAWAAAYTTLAHVDQSVSLGAEDVERLAIAAYLLGKDADSEDLWARAHKQCLETDDPAGAARCAFWLALGLVLRGQMARGGGWFARAQHVLDDCQPDCVEFGYLRIPAALQSMAGRDYGVALASFGEAAQVARRFGDPDLQAMARLGEGQTRIRLGQTAEGVALLDEAMVAVEARQVSPIPAGIIYCAVIEECHAIFDLRRAREWTSALDRWCAAQPDLVPYRGQCLVHRSQIMQLRGAWSDALEEARRARDRLADPPGQPAMGMALYQLAELHRLRGEFTEAEAAYREAVQWGCNPQPGLALLRLAHGQADVARGAIRRALDEAQTPSARAKLLPAHAEIMLADHAVEAARAAADELLEVAGHFDAPFLRAVAAHANGAVLLAEGQVKPALEALRDAWSAWEQIDAPYEAARTRVLVGVACAQLDDKDSGSMEWDAARVVFLAVGAAPDLAALDAATGRGPSATHGLTSREVEVLRLVASGGTNRAIAETLFLSERTVDRHVSNLFNKLGVSSRSAATAFAYEHDLV